MPRVMKRPTFKPDDLVIAFEPFGGSHDGAPFAVSPKDVLRGDDPAVRRYPHMFRRQGDKKALVEYRAAQLAAEQEQQAAEHQQETERAEKQRKQVEELADKLEAEERRKREQQAENQRAAAREREDQARQLQEQDKLAEQARIRALAKAEVARRLAKKSAA